MTSACKKRKLGSISVAELGTLHSKKAPKSRTSEAPSGSFDAKMSATLKKGESSIEEPPRLVESPTSNSVSSPFSDGEDTAWLDDVVLDSTGDPRAMLEQLMKDEPASPLQETSSIFNASAWCS